LTIQPYRTYGNEIKIPFTYLAIPRDADDVLKVANYAFQYGYRVRPSGTQHTWAPFLYSLSDSGSTCPRTILLDTTRHFTSIVLNPPDVGRPDLHSVTVGPGVRLGTLMEFLEKNGLGFYASAAFPTPTIGGLLAIAAHGSGAGSGLLDSRSPGHSPGSMSNLIISMTIVAWDPDKAEYTLKRLHRSDEDIKPFLTSFGRTFMTSVTLRAGIDQNLQSQSHFFVSAEELFVHPDKATDSMRTFSKYLETYGRINPSTFPPGDKFWVMTWHNAPIKPPKSRRSYGPLNYYWMNYYPEFLNPILHILLTRLPAISKILAAIGPVVAMVGTRLSKSQDYWGPSRNHLIYATGDLPRMTPHSLVVVTSRKNLQLVTHITFRNFHTLAKQYEKEGKYPTPGVFDMRVTGLDFPEYIEVPGAEGSYPSFSPLRPVPEFPEFDIALYFDITGYEDNLYLYEFMVKFQSSLYQDLHWKYAVIRAEWAKGWAIAEGGPWRNSTVLNHYARTLSSSNENREWNWAVRTLDKYDPFRIFSNSFLDEFLSER